MIQSKKDFIFYKEADRIISGRSKPSFSGKIKLLFEPDYLAKFMVLLRKVEYFQNCRKGVFSKILNKYYKIKFRKISVKLGFSIPPNVFGPGLFIPHYGTIVVNSKARVGANCVLHTCTCITAKDKINIGDNVYLSTGVIIVGNIELNDNITISSNSMVNKSFDQQNTLIGGYPAKILKDRKAWYLEDGEQYNQRVMAINKLKNTIYNSNL